MLYVPANSFGWQVDNFGATYSDAGFGTNVPGNASANVKGANTALLAGIAEDCWGISICFSGGNTSATIRRQMTDLLIDPAAGVGNAGSSWTVAIANLYSNSPCLGTAGAYGYWYYFPLYLAKGTAIGAAHQDLAAGTLALRMGVRVYGKPSRPEMVRVGHRVETLGATTATTTGVAVTPGTSAQGSLSGTIGTTTRDAWWWQLGVGSADTTMTEAGYQFDLFLSSTNSKVVMGGVEYGVVGAAEQACKGAFGNKLPIFDVVSGTAAVGRGACNGTPDTTMTLVAYALGD